MYSRAAHLEETAADFIGAGADLLDDGGERNSVGTKLVGVEIDLVLAHESADGGYFGHAGNRFELVAKIPVLKTAQVGEALVMAVIHDGVFIDPTRAGGIWADGRVDRLG